MLDKPLSEFTKDDYISVALHASQTFRSGNLDLAWKMYSYREMAFYGEKGRSALGIPMWRGQDLKGKTLALCYEQTLGEHILFSSMFSDLISLGARLIVEIDSRLMSLFRRSFPDVEFVSWGFPTDPKLLTADYYTLMGNPGIRLRNSRDKFPNTIKYLKAKPLEGSLGSPLVGISWYSPAVYDKDNKNVPLEAFRPIYDDTTLDCVSLQYGAKVPKNVPIRELPIDYIKDIDGLASVIDACDVVVTISNTVAHLAGALGKPTYVLLTNGLARLWYWDLPFYPSVIRYQRENEQETWDKLLFDIHKKVVDK